MVLKIDFRMFTGALFIIAPLETSARQQVYGYHTCMLYIHTNGILLSNSKELNT